MDKTHFSGSDVFTFMDTYGLPFDSINDILRENNMFFDVEGFIIAAKKSGNYDDPFRLMNQSDVKLTKLPIMALICRHYND